MYAKTCRTRALLANALWGSNIPVSWRKKEICEAIKNLQTEKLRLYALEDILALSKLLSIFSHNSNLNVKEFEKTWKSIKEPERGCNNV